MLNRLVMSGVIALGCAGFAAAAEEAPAGAPPAPPEMRQRGNMLDRVLNEEEAAAVRAERQKIQEAAKAYRENPGDETKAALKKQILASNAVILPIEKQAVARMEDSPMKQMLEQRIARQEKDPEAAAEMMAQRMTQPRPEGEAGGFRNQERVRRGFGAMPRVKLDAEAQAAYDAEKAKVDKAAEPAKAAVEALKKQIEESFAAQLEIQKKAAEKLADGPEKKRAEMMIQMLERNGEQMRERQLRQLLGIAEPRMAGMEEGAPFGPGAGGEAGPARMGRGRMERGGRMER